MSISCCIMESYERDQRFDPEDSFRFGLAGEQIQ